MNSPHGNVVQHRASVGPSTTSLATMLEARSIAVVGASDRPGSFGERMTAEVVRSAGDRRVHLINPRVTSIGGRECLPSLDALPEPVDLVLLGVRDDRLVEQMLGAANAGAAGAVVFGSAHGEGLRTALRSIAVDAGMALCGAGCMGFVQAAAGVRALGYLERPELPPGPISLVTHSGSVFSALLRTRRALGWTLAVSSGQELVTTTADYLDYVLDRTDTGLIGLVLETVRDGPKLVAAMRRAATRGVPVVLLPIGTSARGTALVQAHSGALAGARGTWEALAEGTGALLVDDLAEFTDTLELLAIGRRAKRAGGIATVHDSGAERTLVADVAESVGVPFASISASTRQSIDAVLDDGLTAENPLDLWGNGADTRSLFAACLTAMAADPAVSVTALAVDLVEEYDGDTSYPEAILDAAKQTDAPLVVLSNLASALDTPTASVLRAAGIPVLEGTRSGLVALKHLLALASGPSTAAGTPTVDDARRTRWIDRLRSGDALDTAESFALLADYGIPVVATRPAASEEEAIAAAEVIGFPVVLKTGEDVAHKTEVGGVVLGLPDEAAVRAAYRELAGRLGPRVAVSAMVQPGVEVAVGFTRDPALGPLVVVAAGGVLAELLADRAVGLPPLDVDRARNLLLSLRIRGLLDGWRGGPPVDVEALVDVIVRISHLAGELGDELEALDVNPLVAGPGGAVAVDVLVQPR